MTNIRKTLLLILATSILIYLPFLSIDYMVEKKASNDTFIYEQCNKVWAHRGYTKNTTQNSISSFSKALSLGAKGIETDVFFDVELNEFIVSHDYPYNLKNGKLLKLQEVLSTFDETLYYWLDFKNLEELSTEDTEKSFSYLKELTERNNITNKVIVESRSVNHLLNYTNKGIFTSYWITINEDIGFFSYVKQIYTLKLKYLLGYFNAVSMDYKYFTDDLQGSLSFIPLLIFTINDAETLSHFLENSNVKVILSDEPFYKTTSKDCG